MSPGANRLVAYACLALSMSLVGSYVALSKPLVAAIPVAPQDSIAPIRSRVDDLIVLATPDPFMAVGHHYRSFAQVDDAEVLEYLSAAKQSRPAHVFPR